jgi:hypothetical protein
VVSSRWLALLPVGFYIAHPFAAHVLHGVPWDALWVCYLADLLLAAGVLGASARLVSVALMWLALGNVCWILHLTAGGIFYPSELLPHVGGLTVAVLATSELGYAAGSWLWAIGGLACCQALCHVLTPAAANVNLAHRVWTGWEWLFPSYVWYLVVLYATAGVLLFAVELLARRVWRRHEG